MLVILSDIDAFAIAFFVIRCASRFAMAFGTGFVWFAGGFAVAAVL